LLGRHVAAVQLHESIAPSPFANIANGSQTVAPPPTPILVLARGQRDRAAGGEDRRVIQACPERPAQRELDVAEALRPRPEATSAPNAIGIVISYWLRSLMRCS